MEKLDLQKAFQGGVATTPAGLVVSSSSVDALIKAEAKEEARKIAASEEEKKGSFFSSFLMQNMALYGAREKTQGTPSFRTLYQASKQSFIDAILIRARIDQQKRVWNRSYDASKLGFRVVHERHDDKNFKGSKEIDERCREMEGLVSDPSPEKHILYYPHKVRPHARLKDFAAVQTRAELIIDRKVMRRLKRRDGKGYAAFHWLPGETIKNVDEALREWAEKNEPEKRVGKYSAEKMSNATGFNIIRAAYVQVVDGLLVDAFAPDEISVHISNPSDEINTFGYGTSRLELSLEVTATLMAAWSFNREMFKTNYPEAILSVAGDFDKEGLQAFKQMLLGDTHGNGNYWRLPVIPAGNKDNFKIESHKLRDTPKDMLFNEFVRLLIMIKAAAYGAHPATLNLQMDSGAGGSALNNGSPVEEIEFNKELSLIPSLQDMAEWITDAIVKPRYPDLKLIVTGLEKDDEKMVVDLRSARVSKWITRNEARMQEGMEPVGDTEDEANPWNYPADVPIPNYLNTFNMLSQQQDDGQGGEDQQDDEEGVDKSLKKSHRRDDGVKFLEIEIGD